MLSDVDLTERKLACKPAFFVSDQEFNSLERGRDSLQVYHIDKEASKGSTVSQLSKSDKARDSCHHFSKKKSVVDSQGIAKLSCENRGDLTNGDLVDGKGLLSNSNFLRCDSVLLISKGGSELGNHSVEAEGSPVTGMGFGLKGKSVPVKWGNNVDAVKNSKRMKGTDYCLVVKGHDMKLRSSKNCFNMSWNLEEEIFKVIDYGIDVGYDFKDKKVKMVDIFAKAISKLMGIKSRNGEGTIICLF
ncbi:hypothetical protein LWI28_018587 [Acer negundo]|uniref:Uncharacterized protein n=1 Tax=Acer negundo TaxID=4023 RepID=A0AAD5IWF3_ACENE|nr:hypothetical protein LWI28_018587 [Acer negundo]